MDFILIVFMYGRGVAIDSVPGFATEQACIVAGEKVMSTIQSTIYNGRFVCVLNGKR